MLRRSRIAEGVLLFVGLAVLVWVTILALKPQRTEAPSVVAMQTQHLQEARSAKPGCDKAGPSLVVQCAILTAIAATLGRPLAGHPADPIGDLDASGFYGPTSDLPQSIAEAR